ncbi:antibiotic biosynthesis monooxygenase [Corallococcus sp. BB11-1]|uniref:antibiotic biosynthesis monooxygenase family protein n=1 Tax=Corallococcus sp. BB11-1 TaxID=2996783 RepID=UPI0022718649|nr:antibiotic biosynthesis monooxygenase family protein [Corallococcus sp. BB11-1]MCY1035388.1 antibiotic biosynthesis monooxygenase [Corallococcus sp. BB11-1]
MIAVIFEVQPHEEHRQRYLDLAATLRPLLADIDGFISIERFQSLAEPGSEGLRHEGPGSRARRQSHRARLSQGADARLPKAPSPERPRV